MVIIKKFTNNKCKRGCGEKETLLDCWWESKLVQQLQKTVWRFPKKPVAMWTTNPTPGTHPEKTTIWKDAGTPVFTAAWLTIAKSRKNARISILRGIDIKNMWYNTYNGGPLNHKKERHNAICSNMDGSKDCHTVSQERKRRPCITQWTLNMIQINIQNETDLQISKTNTAAKGKNKMEDKSQSLAFADTNY